MLAPLSSQSPAQTSSKPRRTSRDWSAAGVGRGPGVVATWLWLALLLAALLACKQEKSEPAVAAPAPVVAQSGGILRVTGALDITLTPQANGATLSVSGTTLSLVQEGTNLELKEGEVRVAKLTSESDRIKLFGPDGINVTHKLKFKADGKLELEDGAGARLYIAKPKDYGFKVSDASDAPVVSVKNKEKRFEAKRESGEEVWRIEGAVSAKAASVLGFEKLDPKLRGALLYMVSKRP